MRQTFATLLLAPFVAGALFFLYMAWQDSDYAPAIIPFVIGGAAVWIFSPQINWWWYSRRPPELPAGLQQLIERSSVFYRNLSSAQKQRFRQRVALFTMAVDWIPMGWPEERVPLDIQIGLAIQAVTLTFNEPKFLFDAFEKVVVYPRPFPSPEHDYLHASELYAPDGCLLFSAEQLMISLLQPGSMYNIGMHEYARAFIRMYPNKPYPILLDSAEIWSRLEACSRMSRAHVESVIGIAGVEPLPVAIHHYFSFPQRFRAEMPEAAAALDEVFSGPLGS